jgi:hypothetical protein
MATGCRMVSSKARSAETDEHCDLHNASFDVVQSHSTRKNALFSDNHFTYIAQEQKDNYEPIRVLQTQPLL